MISLLVSLLSIMSCSKDHVYNPYKAKNVVVVIIDGPRYSESWGDPAKQYIPYQANVLAPKAVVGTGFKNQGLTETTAGHTAITTGVYEVINNAGLQIPAYHSIFQEYLRSTGKPSEKAWIITSKDKLYVLGRTLEEGWQNQFLPRMDCGINGWGTGNRFDSLTLQHVIDTMRTHKPNLVMVNFREPDYTAHSGSWPGYIQGIKDTDRYLKTLIEFLETSPDYKDNTAIFVTNDHGRHLDTHGGFQHHGDACTGCRQLNFFALGPDFKSGIQFSNEYDQTDLSATIAEILGLKMKHSNGEVMKAIFKDPN